MSANKSKNSLARLFILLVAVCVPLLFVAGALGTSYLFKQSAGALIVVAAIAIAIYNGMTAGLLFKYFETDAPWYRFIPCYGELTIMDNKYLRIGSYLYIGVVIFLAATALPFVLPTSVVAALPQSFPLWTTMVALAFLVAIQVVKGLGILNCSRIIAHEWDAQIGGSLGLIKKFEWFGFLPFIRVMAVYALNKPLSTLVTFNGRVQSDAAEAALEEQ